MNNPLKLVQKILLPWFFVFLAALLGISNAQAVPVLYADQSSALSGAADTVRLNRMPVKNNAGTISYWDVTLKFTADGITGKPALSTGNILITQSPVLLSASFRAGKYKDAFGNYYTVTGPGATIGGRSNWSAVMTKNTGCGATCAIQASWTTGAIAGHPLQTKITAQGITIPSYNYGTVNFNLVNSSVNYYLHWYCSQGNDIVGFVQVGDQIVMHGFCNATKVETNQFTLSLCTATNPCP